MLTYNLGQNRMEQFTIPLHPQSNDEDVMNEMGGGVVQMFQLFVQDCSHMYMCEGG